MAQMGNLGCGIQIADGSDTDNTNEWFAGNRWDDVNHRSRNRFKKSLERKIIWAIRNIRYICNSLILSACGYNQIQLFLLHIQNEAGN